MSPASLLGGPGRSSDRSLSLSTNGAASRGLPMRPATGLYALAFASALLLGATTPGLRAQTPLDAAEGQPAVASPAGNPSTGQYPIPYVLPKAEDITAVLHRLLAHLDKASPTAIVEKGSLKPITDLKTPVADAVTQPGDGDGFATLDYTNGVTLAGALLCGEVTGDDAFLAYCRRHTQFIHDSLPYFRAQQEKFGSVPGSFRKIIAPRALDDCGAVCAALVKLDRAHVGPDLRPVIDGWADFISHGQFRLADGTLARHRPQPESVWADDCYMSIPALAQLGVLTGDKRYTDDAVNQVLGFAKHLFNWDRGLYMHGQNLDQPDNPEFYWGRANGWAMMATVETLSVLPEDDPRRPELLKLLRAHIKGVATLQSGSGFWHQMLDKEDSYLETSCTAMFAFSIARAVNRGWIAPVSYGTVAQTAWNALTTRITADGALEGTAISTTFASDNVYYYNRRASDRAAHGYGPTLMAGAEMIKMLSNPAFHINYRNSTYHYVPADGPDSTPE